MEIGHWASQGLVVLVPFRGPYSELAFEPGFACFLVVAAGDAFGKRPSFAVPSFADRAAAAAAVAVVVVAAAAGTYYSPSAVASAAAFGPSAGASFGHRPLRSDLVMGVDLRERVRN